MRNANLAPTHFKDMPNTFQAASALPARVGMPVRERPQTKPLLIPRKSVGLLMERTLRL